MEQSYFTRNTKNLALFNATRVKYKTPWCIVWRRLGGDAIDWILCGFGTFAILFALSYVPVDEIQYVPYLLLWGTPFISLILLKDILPRGTSIGKRIMSLKLVSVRNPAEKISIFRYLIRNISVLIAPVEILMLLLFRYRIGDILTSTTVIDDGECSGWQKV